MPSIGAEVVRTRLADETGICLYRISVGVIQIELFPRRASANPQNIQIRPSCDENGQFW